MRMTRLVQSTAVYVVAFASLGLTGCGGGDGQSPPPTASTPTPSSSPSPSPSPTPSPTPSPSNEPSLGGAQIGDKLVGPLACSDGAVTQSAEGFVTGLGTITKTKIDNQIEISFLAQDSFSTDVNGFGGSAWAAVDKRTPPNSVYVRYSNAQQGELLLSQQNQTFATQGLYNTSALCFFAVGLAPPSLPSGQVIDYFGIIDGFGVIGGQQKRLYESRVGLKMDFASGKGVLTADIEARANPFGDYADGTSTDVGTVTANVELVGGSANFSSVTFSGTGLSGQIVGRLVSNEKNVLGKGGAGAVFVFELTSSGGDVLYGAMALHANIM